MSVPNAITIARYPHALMGFRLSTSAPFSISKSTTTRSTFSFIRTGRASAYVWHTLGHRPKDVNKLEHALNSSPSIMRRTAEIGWFMIFTFDHCQVIGGIGNPQKPLYEKRTLARQH